MKQKTHLIKTLLITSVIMLFIGIPTGLPYGYYTLLRLVVFISSGLITIAAYKLQRQGWMITMGLITLLFNPIIPVHLDKATWSLLDVAVAILFIVILVKIKIVAK